MHWTWDEIDIQIEQLVVTSDATFAPATLQNTADLIACAKGRYTVADEFGLGYWATVRLSWNHAEPAPMEIEIHEGHFELYQFSDGQTSIDKFDRLPHAPLPAGLLKILDRSLMDRTHRL
jgi:hypothetical protein